MKHLITLIILLGGISFSQSGFDHSLFDDMLTKAVSNNGLVDYQYFEGNKKFNEYLDKISNADISGYSAEEKLAFFINSYNACVIKNVLNHFPLQSPMDVEGFFKKYKFKVAGEELSLDNLEYEKVLKIEPVLSHFGLVCAAKSCPKLIQRAYTAENVYTQLNENMKIYLRDTSQNYLDNKNKTLNLSQIFNWFKDSFEKKFGSLNQMAERYMNNSDSDFIAGNEIKINFLKYNWKLNSQ